MVTHIWRSTLAATAGLLLIFGMMGCSTGTPGDTATDPLTSYDPPWVQALPSPAPATLLSAEQVGNLTSMLWRLSTISADQQTIQVVYVAGDGDCFTPAGFHVVVASGSIQLGAYSHKAADRTACASLAVLGRAQLRLPQQLTSEVHLLHVPVASEWNNPALLSN